MAEVDAGAPAPAVATPPAADAVPAPAVPTGQDNAEAKADESVQPPKTYSEEEARKIVNERLTKERRRIERQVRAEVERDYLRQQLEARDKPPASDQPKGKPQYKDYEGRPEEFVEALAEWKLEQREAARVKETEAQRSQREAAEEGEYIRGKLAEASVQFPDLDARLSSEDIALTRPMLDFVVDAEDGFAVGDYLANNPAESKKIALLRPVKQVLALEAIAKRLKAPPEPTKVPSPIVPTTGKATADKDWDELTQAEFNERRRRQKAALKS